MPLMMFSRFMSYNRFEQLRKNVRFSFQPTSERDREEPSCRWKLVDDFVDAINKHREEFFTPSEMLCVDESISRWYGVGGHWLGVGLPMYITMDRKPENGCKIQSSCCGKSGMLTRLQIIKSADDDNCNTTENMPRGTQETIELVRPWLGSWRLTCGDSHFASVRTAEIMYENGMFFEGCIKNATKRYPMKPLSETALEGRGDSLSMLSSFSHDSKEYRMAAVAWVDRNRRYLISTAGKTIPGAEQVRVRWRKRDGL